MNLGPDRHAESAMSLVDVLQRRAQAQPEEVVYTFLLNGGTEEAQLSYGELDRRARAVAVQLQQIAPAGARALLLYPPGLDYLIAFYGCLYAGVIAVPAYPPNPARLNRSLSRLRTIVQSARPAVALTTALIQMAGEQLVADDPDFRSIRWLATDTDTPAAADLWQVPDIRSETLAFLQYTSGSTSEPKGVMLTHANLLHNSLLIQHCFGHTRHSRGVIWLPPYHDMGLIGGIIQPLFVGFPVTLLSPVDFLQRPLLWLHTISRTRATTSGGPNFAYDLCVRKIGPAERASLDLSSWDLAFNGAEPIRAETLERFAAAFGPSGFRREAFYPCYGLAEATLIVTGTVKGQPPLEAGFESAGLEQNHAIPDSGPAARVLVGSGLPQPDHPLLIVHPERQTPCGPGEVGEIWVAGPSIAQGYWECPAQSAHAFQARLADDNSGPFLRTGDLGFLRDGQLFVTGRLKDLLIIRGRNYYPQDIELTVERSHPALRPGCTAAFTVEVEGEERLVVVQELDRQHRKQPVDAVLAAVRQAVADQHELHLHAVVLIGHGSIPKTSSGKIQRHACKAAFLADRLEVVGQQVSAVAPADDDLPSLGRSDLLEAPAAERAQLLERFVRQQIARTLGLQTTLIKPGQSLTGLGLDSLMSVDLQHALERELGAPVALADLLDGPDVAELAGRLLPLLDAVGSAPAEEPAADEQADAPLTYGQRALWLIHQLAPERGAYHLSNALRLRLPLDPQALLRSFQRLVDRHPALRTRFPLVDGQPVQRVLPADRVAFAAEDASGWDDDRLERYLLALAYRPFDLERDPLLRVALLSRTADDHVLLVTVHHLITDFWSLALLARELPALYAAELSGAPAELPAPQSDYRTYARWQRAWLAGAEGERLWRYWQGQLAGPLPVLNLPTDRPRPAVQRFEGASLLQTLDPELSRRAHALAEAHGATLYALLLAAFGALLQRYSGQDDLLIGTVTAGRSRAAHAGVAGYFVNPLVLRLRPAQQLRFSDLLRQTRQTALEGFAHQDYPFPLLVERLQPERDPSRSPLFQVMLMFQQPPHHSPAGLGALAVGAPDVRVSLGGLAAESHALPAQTAQFDLTLLATEHDGRLLLNWNYDTDLFDAATIARMAGHFQTLLAGALAAPDTRLAELPLLGEAELRVLRDEGATAAPGLPDGCLHELVVAQAARTPDAPALRFGNRTLSYRELDRRSNQLAQLLRRRGVGPETLVALCAERTPELVIGLLGILKAGGAYIPLDPHFPPERLALMLEDARPALVLTAGGATAPVGPWATLDLEADWPLIARAPDDAPPSHTDPSNLAYVIYTSGSTGRPKGVQISHAALVNFLRAMARQPGISPEDVVLLVTTLSFDIAALELFLPLTAGACLQIVPREVLLDGAVLARTLRQAGVTLMQATPATWRLLLEAGWEGEPRLTALCGGEAFPRDLADALLGRCRAVWNMYGPTETTIWSAAGELRPDSGPVTLGPPIANTQLYVLDPQMQLVPHGVPGELYIGGDGLARGYGGRPDLTAERFVPNPFGERLEARGWRLVDPEAPEATRLMPHTSGEKLQASSLKPLASRLYKTGDLVRRLADGRIEFLGRLDHQVKVRGFRIELGEIELALAGHPALRQVVVLARADGRAADKQLVAYAVAHSGQKPSLADLRAFLHERLPDYMIPTSLVLLEALPLTPNGKIDRKALPAPQNQHGSAAQRTALPRSGLERTIAAIWREVLQREQIGLHDSFFDLGGHSMLLAQVHQRLRAALPVELSIVELFQYPTVAALARHLSLQGAAAGLLADPRGPRRPVSAAGRAVAIVGMAGRFPGAGDIEQLWANLRDGVESITFFSEEELLAAGVEPAALRAPNYVRARATLADADLFDAAFFGFTPREAEILDPQHRLFLEAAWNALEHAGYDSERYGGRIGVFAGVGINSYLLEADRTRIGAAGRYQAFISNDKDFAPTRVSYKLNLRGPSVNVQTACSSSLVALHLACQSLITGESDMALAGGVTVGVPQQTGYFYEEGGIPSPDGHCRAFDAEARGTVFGSGVGVVLLKPLADALADGDTIYAVVKGTAINNDGAGKIGYTAPSVDGQAEVIDAALAVAEVPAETIGYVEAHGTGTSLGDPIEIAALSKAYRAATDRRQFCAIGSLKTNIGHLDTAAGVAGLVKTALALHHGLIPPSLHFQNPNPQIDFANSPFFVNTALRPWPDGDGPRRAGVSSFGIGGTNAHVILEEAPAAPEPAADQPWQLLPLAARTPAALDQATERLAAHLRAHPEQPLADVAYTLQAGRRHFPQRRALVCRDRDEALALLETRDPARLLNGAVRTGTPAVAFMFPGQGAQYPGMARDLYGHEAVFREAIDRCAAVLKPLLGLDIRPLIFDEAGTESTKDTKGTNGSGYETAEPRTENREPSGEARGERREAWEPGTSGNAKRNTQNAKLTETQFAQPALFAVEYALALLWHSWGVVPSALIGHSIGEYVAATLAGVFRLEDALALVAARGRMMQALPAGAMLSVQLPEGELLPLLDSELSLAAVNGPRACVAAGPEHAVAALEGQLVARAIPCRRLHTSHAFHSAMMDPLVETFAAEVARVQRQAPQLPFVSNRTGTWITAEQAADPRYWAEHLRHAVRFADGISTLLADPDTVLLEVGPGTALSSLARQIAPQGSVFACMRHPGDSTPDQAALLGAAARLWLAGVALDWAGVHTNQPRRRVALPTYPFERKRFWIGGRPGEQPAPAAPGRAPLDNWFYTPLWRQTALPEAGRQPETAGQPWLVFADSCGVAQQLRTALEAAGSWVATVEPGGAFRALGAGRYQIRPGERADYDALLDELNAAGLLPHTVVHAWNVAAYEKKAGVRLERAQALGFDSLLLLAQALARQKPPAPVQIGLVTGHMQRIAGEHEHAPEQAICLGLCRVIPQELPGLTCRSIDIALERDGGAPDGLGELLLAELSGPGETQPVAYRGAARWVQAFEPLRLAPPERPDSGLRQGGVYLITGGLGGIGLTLARLLADSVQARLVLTSRRGLPPRAEWPALLAEGPEEIRTAIQTVQALEAQGSPVLALQADVADVQAMRSVVRETLEHFGALHGVIHAAGVPGGGVIQLKTREAAARVLAPKLQGTLALLEATYDLPLDLIVLCSSITAVAGGFGQSDYCGANAFLDALAAAPRRRNGPRVVAINWDRWREVGMAVRSETAGGLWALQQGTSPVRHPLLDRCLLSNPEHAIYWTELGVERHWVLSEHLIAGLPTVPGTSYLEMARAAFAHATGQRDAELREVIFVAPLTARSGERKDVLTILEQRGEGYEFRVVSRARPAAGTPGRWQEHARGRVRAAGPQPAPLVPAALAEGLRPLDLAETAGPRPEGSADFLLTGPRWDNLRQVFASDTNGLALLELRNECAGDLRDYTLHPALLDTAAGAVKFMGAGDYLPLTYASMQVFQPFPARIYSAIRPKNGAGKDVLSCDITILDEEGAVLALIEGFSMRRITPALLTQLQSGGIQPAALLDDASAGLYDELLAPALADAERGIAPAEGIAAFTRILAGRAAQVIVSTGDLAQEQERVGRLTGAQLIERLARPGSTRAEAPASLSGISASEIEQRLIGIWRSVLGVEQIGVNDNFFELGGTSLSGIQVIAEIKHVFGVDIPAVSIFDAPTVSALVRYLQPTQHDQTFDHSRDRARKRGQALDMFKGGRR